jgi:HAD superfamily hydrolase (TIGR01509 family)
MISFLQYISEGKKVRVFDFDDTLAKTDSGVIVRHKKTGNTRRLSSGEFARFGPDDDEELDFSEFNQVKNAKPIKPADKIAREVSRKKKQVVILTARHPESAKSIRKYLKGRGISGKHLKIIAVGSSDPNAKRVALKAHLTGKKKITHVEFMDDHRANLEAVGELKKEFPKIKFRLRVAKQHK